MGPVKPPGIQAAPGAAVSVNNAGSAPAPAGGFARISQPNTLNSLSQLASGLRLPQDNLTFTLLTFARVFSLPLESVIKLRKEVLAFIPSSPKTEREKAMAEAFSLASAAAAAKGLKLSQEALGEYAAAMGDFPEGNFAGSSDGEGEGQNENHQGKSQNQADGESPENLMQPPNPAELKESFDRFSERDGLLGLMNRIFKENEQNWVVWPFKMSAGGTDLKVFVRILIEEPFLGPGLLMADITGPRRHWRFFLEKSREGKFRARIGLSPGLEPLGLKALEREAAKALGSFLGCGAHVQVLNGEILLADFMGCEALPSINEEV
jgi:hypothetical protein